MTDDDLTQIKRLLGDLRFVMAAASVGMKTNDSKQPIEYMRNINRLEDLLANMIKDKTK